MSNPSTDQELKRQVRNITFDCFEGDINSHEAADRLLVVIREQRQEAFDSGVLFGKRVEELNINREKAALQQYTTLIEQELINEVGYPKFRAIKDAIEAHRAKLTKEDK